MGKVLVVAEKPSVGRDIADVLHCTSKKDGYIEGDDYIITWAIGHLVGLKEPQEHNEDYKSWDIEDLPLFFDIKDSLKVLPKTKDQFKVVKTLINRSDIDYIINAGDAGREGYLIQKWIYRLAGNKKPEKVLWLSSMTKEGIENAMNNLKDDRDFHNLLLEAEARAEGDQLLGINYSRALTLTKTGGNTTLSYGRCQTPLLNQIVLRDEEIENFKPEPYFNVEATFDKGYKGIYITLNGNKKEKVNFKTKEEAELLSQKVNNKNGIVQSYKQEDKTKNPPLLYNLAALQKTMGAKYGYSPEQTLQIAQSLYETHKIMSYPRTDSQYLSTDLYNEIKDHVMSCHFGDYAPLIDKIDFSSIKADKRYFNDHKVTDHHALIPTINSNTANTYNRLTDEEKNVFDCVVRSLIAIFYPDCEYSVTEIITNVEDNLFYTKGSVIKKKGYKEVISQDPGDYKNKNEEDKEQELPQLNENDSVHCDSVQILDKMTKPPARYTVSSIIALMEKYNIGTSATRAEIINKLIKRNFITLEKKKYYTSTELGRNYVKVIPDRLKEVTLTADFEMELGKINEGTLTKEAFLNKLLDDFKKDLVGFKTDISNCVPAFSKDSLGKCPCCGSAVVENSKAFGCTNFKNGCKFVIWKKIAGRMITKANVKQLLEDGKTSEIKGFVSKSGKSFNTSLILKDNGKTEDGKYPIKEVSFNFENSGSTSSPKDTDFVCPDCKNKLQDVGWGYKCDCGLTVGKKIANRELSHSELTQLFRTGKTDKLTGFISKAGKKFNAVVRIEDKKTTFDFT